MNKKLAVILYSVLSVVLVALVAFYLYLQLQVKESNLFFNNESLIALNRNAVKGETKDRNAVMYFEFTQLQKVHVLSTTGKYSGSSLTLTIESVANKKKPEGSENITFAYLYDEDFEKENSLKKKLASRPEVKIDFNESAEKIKLAEISMCIKNDDKVPAGFYVKGTEAFKINSVKINSPVVGWRRPDSEKNIKALFAFSCNGGEADFSFTKADFTNAEQIFENRSFYPLVKLDFVHLEDIGTPENQTRVKGKYGDEDVYIRRAKTLDSVNIQSAAYKNPYSLFELTKNAENVTSVLMMVNEKVLSEKFPDMPIKVDLGLILDWPQEHWRNKDYELFEWDQFPGVLFFDFADYRIQSDTLTRLAYFAEKAGYKGTLVDDDFVENKHGYNAHDYKAFDLAAFYTLAKKEKFNLNPREIKLLEILLFNKIIYENKEGYYEPGTGCIISFSRESPEYLRWTFMAHESWHGIFFTSQEFRNLVAELYENFDPLSLEFVKGFWQSQPSLCYDSSDDYLMKNEFMAYIMQQKYEKVGEYFVSLANRWSVGQAIPELCTYMKKTNAEYFVQAGQVLNNYAFDKWGLACGRVSLITK